MWFGLEALETLLAVCDEGSFTRAAQRLHLTPGAISQRITSLETQIGHPVVQRTQPVKPTTVGEELLGLARHTLLLQDETWIRLAQVVNAPDPQVRVSLAVNADSLSTWFKPVVQTLAAESRLLLSLRIEDQDRTSTLLRSGAVLAAVTTNPHAGPGTSVESLGSMRYIPVCASAIAPASPQDLPEFLSATPMLQFDSLDLLPFRYLDKVGVTQPPPAHYVPSNREFFEAIRLGLGWSVIPEGQVGEGLEDDSLVVLDHERHIDVALHWQRWKVHSPILDHLTNLVNKAARMSLHHGV